jgi:hypothetical protein
VIVAEQVEDPVDKESSHLITNAMAHFKGLADRCIHGYDHIAQEVVPARELLPLRLREGKDVCGAVLAPVGTVEGTDLRVVGDKDTQLGVIPVQVA